MLAPYGVAMGDSLAVFRSSFGWVAIVGSGEVVRALTFGHATARAAAMAIPVPLRNAAVQRPWCEGLARRIQAFLAGVPEDFGDVRVDPGPQTPFQARVMACLRQVGWGRTITYAELARQAGFPRAARAVGNCLAANRIPLILPCHRVVGTGGRLGGFSAPGGVATKRRLLLLEGSLPPAAR